MHVRFSRWTCRVALVALLTFLLLPTLPGTVVHAATYTVGTTADSGSGSLRDAIDQANTGAFDTINVSIGSGAQTIFLGSALPAVTAANVTINATTQPGYAGGPIITLNGGNAGVGGIGFKLFGGSTTVIGFVIAGFVGSGIYIGSNSNVVQNCVLTSNVIGVNINTANSNTIGGTTAANRNIISGNSNSGIFIGGGATGNQIQGNFVGTDTSGRSAAPNAVGIFVTSASGNTIGPGNVISGNTTNGIALDTNTGNVTSNSVRGNFIGTDATGTAQVLLSNGIPQNVGVAISAAGGAAGGSASNNTIGGPNPGDRNIISGNYNGNLTIVGLTGTATGNVVQGNYIGLDVNGTTPVGHCDAGIYIRGASGNIIGPGNIISGNSRQGLNSTGLAIDGSDGFPTQNNVVKGNLIGTDKTGGVGISNGAGVYIAAASNNTVGGTTAADRNIISGNSISNGVAIDGRSTLDNSLKTASGNVVQGNYIGTNTSGTAAVANGTGMTITNASGNLVGGTATGARNVISGNTQGVSINILDARAVAQSNTVQGNFIGTNAAGTGAVPNSVGVSIAGVSGNAIGGTAAGARNIISGNRDSGIYLNGFYIPPAASTPPAVSNNLIQGNYIGTDVSGTNALGNGNRGIQLDGANNNVVDSNVIANNTQQGVLVNGATGDAIVANPIYANGAESIRLVSGGNNGQPAPNLTGAAPVGGNQVTVTGTVSGPANTLFRIDLFNNSTATSQGKVYLGSFFPTSDGSGVARINNAINVDPSMGFITATATPTGTNNTSAFSTALAVPPPVTGTGIGIWRGGSWYLRNSVSSGNPTTSFAFGTNTDIPLMCDWFGTGHKNPGIYRNGVFYMSNSTTTPNVTLAVAFGSPGDIPICGDWTGQGKQTIGIFRGGAFYLSNSNDAPAVNFAFAFGSPGDIPVVGDWTGQRKQTIGIFRGGAFYLSNSNSAPAVNFAIPFCSSSDIPVVGDWTNQGKDTIGFYRGGFWYLSNSNTAPAINISFVYGGASGDKPLVWKV